VTNPQTSKADALKSICDGIVDSVKAAGPLGCPAGTLYAALMAYGATLEQFEMIMGMLVQLRKLRKQGDLYFVR
jgi:hypothetical protein